MNTNEGTHRIKLLGKCIILFGSVAGAALWILMFGLPNASSGVDGRIGLWGMYIFVAPPVVCGAMVWVIAWIVEGFMTSSDQK